ncbi:hypothetical protein FE810_02830 [Thalassotalea litorea]|uniref:Uncharacterized protein n=1 Tax=Thalassotalea litorea TaxID=2020715 RepID=A0A5R9INW8_9GAMM|nr:hypothetical protein [Thalassotalea litorea]TLU67234.1 hypothetical protein FE810_02830 [Thalassotalea litorea]
MTINQFFANCLSALLALLGAVGLTAIIWALIQRPEQLIKNLTVVFGLCALWGVICLFLAIYETLKQIRNKLEQQNELLASSAPKATKERIEPTL